MKIITLLVAFWIATPHVFALELQQKRIGYTTLKIETSDMSLNVGVWGVITKKEGTNRPWTWVQIIPANEGIANVLDITLDKAKIYTCELSGTSVGWNGAPVRALHMVYRVGDCTEE